LAVLAAARHAGVPVAAGLAALGRFQGVKRRMELRGEVAGVRVYDDFAHHPTAIATTLAGLRGRVGSQRILAVLEPRSSTMRLGCHNQALAGSLSAADRVFVFAPPDLGWDAAPVFAPLAESVVVRADLGELVDQVLAESRTGDHILVMSNGAFGGIHERLLAGLETGVGGGDRAIRGGA
jgi:UDP-N-acetylmuramate: L-alanyl-gamma-D-glutamyl-meso-diaminopimelate ligase